MFDWTTLLLQVANGLTFGGLLFILASGFMLIFGLMRIVNMAHGAYYILGAYLAYSATRNLNNWVLGVVAATVGNGLLALASYTIVRRVKGDLPQNF